MKLSDLEQYRNEDGFIDFDRIDIEAFSPKMEERGTESREKVWLHLEDATILLKTVEQETNLAGTCYAELITSELARQAGFETANVDLAKYKNFCGIISQKVNKGDEQLHSLREYIGDEEIPNDPVPEITSLNFVFENMAKYLKENSDMPKENKKLLLLSILKLMVFDVMALSTDRHTENISFIERMNNGEKEIVLAPLYDNEFSLMLETREEDLKEYLGNSKLFYGFVDAQEPKIAPKYDDMEHSVSSHYIDLLEEVIGMDEEIEEFAEYLMKKLDVVEAVKKVEGKIGTHVPSVFRDTAVYAFNRRKRAIEKSLFLDIGIGEDE